MAGFDNYTPSELVALKNQLEQLYQGSAIQNQNLNTAAGMTQNLSPWANLGIALGTIGGRMAAQNWNDRHDLRLLEEYNRRENAKNMANETSAAIADFLPHYQGATVNQLRERFPNQLSVTQSPLGRQLEQRYSQPYETRSWVQGNSAPNPALLDNRTTPTTVPNNAVPSTALFSNNDAPYYDWKRTRWLIGGQPTPPSYLNAQSNIFSKQNPMLSHNPIDGR